MKMFLSIFLFFIFTSCNVFKINLLDVLKNKSLPVFNKKHNKKEKLKIGVIDSNPLLVIEEIKPYLSTISFSDPANNIKYPRDLYHGDAVVRTISNYFKSHNISNVEIIYCEISSEDLDLAFCLEKMYQQKLFAINISIEIKDLSEKELLIYKKILNTSVQVFVAGGNYGENQLCSSRYPNLFCVAGKSYNGLTFTTPIYENITHIEEYCGQGVMLNKIGTKFYSKSFCGSSYSAPILLAKSISSHLINLINDEIYSQLGLIVF